jgi:hypothetical protein
MNTSGSLPEKENLDDYCELMTVNGDPRQVFTGLRPEFLRKAFLAQFETELFWLVNEKEKTVLFVVSEKTSRFHEVERSVDWLDGFLDAFKAIDEYRNPKFVPGPEADKDVHTEHCCHRHGCKYGYGHDFHAKKGRSCPVETGEKKQSYPCESCHYEPSEPW